jgi:hypothetical protein
MRDQRVRDVVREMNAEPRALLTDALTDYMRTRDE